MGDHEEGRDGWFTPEIRDKAVVDRTSVYFQAFYFIVTTMTTVGYGDMYATTVKEQFFCVYLMLFGVFYFSMISGSLTSILSSLDQSSAELEKKVLFLARLQTKFALPPQLVDEIKRSLSYDNRQATNGLVDFIQSLCPQLRIAVTMSMYSESFNKHEAFKELKNRRLLTFIAQNFH